MKEDLPKIIGDYKFVRNFNPGNNSGLYKFAIYKNSSNKLAFAKIWVGKTKNDLNYFLLKNDEKSCRLLNNEIEKNKIPNRFKKIFIPKVLNNFETKDSYVVLFEYIENISRVKTEDKFKIYSLVLDYIKYLNSHLSSNDKKEFAKKGFRNMVIIYPFLLAKAILKNPQFSVKILNSTFFFISSLPLFVKYHENSLIHGDLQFKNILKSGDKIFIIDFENCKIANPFENWAYSLMCSWIDKDDFHLPLLKKIKEEVISTKENNILFRSLFINAILHGLIDAKTLNSDSKEYIKCLDFALNSKEWK